MEPVHSQFIHAQFKCDPNKVLVLDVSNNYVRNDPELIRELESKVRPLLEMEDRLRAISVRSFKE